MNLLKTETILNMTAEELEKELTEENWEYSLKRYVTINNALDTYQDGAKLSGQDEYLEPNEYFSLEKEQEEEMEEEQKKGIVPLFNEVKI